MQNALEWGGKVARRRRITFPHKDKADVAHVGGDARLEPTGTRWHTWDVVHWGRAGHVVAFTLKCVGDRASAH
jgi:hypothetical protein